MKSLLLKTALILLITDVTQNTWFGC